MTHVPKRDVQKVADIVRDAGGRIVGRTRLQKISYLLELAGLGDGFSFEYRHYGPYSEALAHAAERAGSIGIINEEEFPASWGGLYSVFTADGPPSGPPARTSLAHEAVSADPIALELAATAAFLAASGASDPWRETAERKSEKAQGGRLETAKMLYRRLQRIETPRRLPDIA
jgi:hypothetical protein